MSARTLLILSMASVLALAGCLGAVEPNTVADTPGGVPDAKAPTFPLPDVITGFSPVTALETKAGGNGIWIDEEANVLFASTGGGGLVIADVTDPENPVELSVLSDNYARDVDVLHWQGARYAVLAGSGNGIHLVDTTDPAHPEFVSTTTLPGGVTAHNIAVVPGTPYIYNSGSGGVIHGLDATNPAKPKVFTFDIPSTVNGHPVTSDGCHDVTVRVDLGKAFCAGGGGMYGQGGGEAFIWDISADPTNPKWVGLIENPFVVYFHQAIANEAGDVLIINDEFIAPNCFREDAGPVTAQTPTAAVWFYDISDPANPEMLSYVQPPRPDAEPVVNCGSHFGDLVDGRETLVMGWYQGGTILVDFTDAENPELLDIAEPVGSTWDARYHNGHVFTGSGDVQVLRLV